MPTGTDSANQRPGTIPWPPLLLGLVLLGGWVLGQHAPLAWPGQDDFAARIVGFGFGVIGVALAGWAVVTLMRHRTTVMPNATSTALVTAGPYAWRRNPIYLGEVFMMFGVAELTKNIWFVVLAFVFAILVTYLQILPEERHLEARFGQAWRDYAAKTRRWI